MQGRWAPTLDIVLLKGKSAGPRESQMGMRLVVEKSREET